MPPSASHKDYSESEQKRGIREVGWRIFSREEIKPAAAILERVVAEHPGMTGYRNDLAFASMNLARANRVLGRPADALRALERTRSNYEPQPPDVMTLYNLACTESLQSDLAIGSERDANAVRAVATLR
jgi:hypothetical protein